MPAGELLPRPTGPVWWAYRGLSIRSLGLARHGIILFGSTSPRSLMPQPIARSPLSPLPAALVATLLGLAWSACGDSSGSTSPGAGTGGGTEAAADPAGRKKSAASATLAYQTGLQLLLRGEPEKARDELARATELDPKMSEAFFELGKLEVHLSSQTIGSQARDLDVLERGIADLEKARDLEPNNDEYAYWVGRAYSIDNDVDNALANLNRAVEINPKHAPAWKRLGLVLKDAGRMEEAKASFQKAIENDPAEAGARFQLGQTLEQLKDLEGARAAYEASIQIDPTSPEVFGRLTQVCAMLGDAEGEERANQAMESWKIYDKRLQNRRRKVNQNPADAVAVRRLGEIYLEVGKWEDALEWFLKSLHLDPRDSLTHLYCGIVRRHLRDYPNALNHLKEAEFLAPDHLEPKLELLHLYADSGDRASFDELLTSLEEAAKEDGDSLFAIATLLQTLERNEDAQRLFAEAKALGVTEARLPQADVEEE